MKMKKTRALLASVMAPLALGIPAARIFSASSPTPTVRQSASEDDAHVKNDAKAIEQWLSTERKNAKSVEEIQQNFSQMTGKQVQAALDYLIDENRLRKTGEGSKDNPYRYYRPECNEC